MSRPLSKKALEALATCDGFARGVLGLKPYPWATKVFHDLDKRGSRVALKAANGSGKTSAVAAPAALWHASVFPNSLTVCTSGVFRQVEAQLFGALHSHRSKFRGWEWNATSITTNTGSRIIGFAADDSGRAEGWHNDNLLIVADEAKSIPDPIFAAIERCQPTRLLLLSSPGGCSGEFFEAFHSRRKFYSTHSVTAYQCAHIQRDWINEQLEKYGKDHPLIRSMVFAEFMDDALDGSVIPLSYIERCLDGEPDKGTAIQAFCDFAAGGDENVLAVRRGNTVKIVAAWTELDTMKAVGKFVQLFKSEKLKASEIAADEGGLGRVMCDRLRENGWSVTRVNNGSRAHNHRAYANRGSEIWFEGRAMIEGGKIILPNDRELISQLSSRRGFPTSSGKLMIEPKKDMRNRGIKSPDKADAVLAAIVLGSYGPRKARKPRRHRTDRFQRLNRREHHHEKEHPFFVHGSTDQNRRVGM